MDSKHMLAIAAIAMKLVCKGIGIFLLYKFAGWQVALGVLLIAG